MAFFTSKVAAVYLGPAEVDDNGYPSGQFPTRYQKLSGVQSASVTVNPRVVDLTYMGRHWGAATKTTTGWSATIELFWDVNNTAQKILMEASVPGSTGRDEATEEDGYLLFNFVVSDVAGQRKSFYGVGCLSASAISSQFDNVARYRVEVYGLGKIGYAEDYYQNGAIGILDGMALGTGGLDGTTLGDFATQSDW